MTKDHILSEIRRTAAENGGIPLGVHRFFSETGIKVADWRGRHWIRWSEALKEAGFAPNRLSVAWAEEELLGSLLKLVRELGHYPVEAEVMFQGATGDRLPEPRGISTNRGEEGAGCEASSLLRRARAP